ncbi:MAG: hypothetical protein FJX02_03350 [Alphaproteobacteria bacterium]|nr:hypothetical protein [Alphaproteobacteria bacterium]
MRAVLTALAMLVATSAPAVANCPLDLGRGLGWAVFSSQHLLAMRPDPPQIEVGEPFALLLNVCDRRNQPAQLVAIDATMPEHAHGMNYRPRLIDLGDGRYRVEGMVFHMPGRWELALDVRSGDTTERLTHDMMVQ